MQSGPAAAVDTSVPLATSALFATLIIVVTLGIDPWGWDAYGPLRWALTSTLAAALVAVSVFRHGFARDRLRRAEKTALVGIVLGAGIGVAAAPEVLHAVIGTPDRHFGAFTWLLCVGVYVATRGEGLDLRLVGRAAAASGLALGVWTGAELLDVGWFASDFAEDRAGGPFSQPAYLGAAAVLLGPAGLTLLDRARGRRDRLFGWAGAAGAVLALLGSGSRAAVVGLVVAAAVTTLVRRDALRRKPGRRTIPIALAVAVTAVATPARSRIADAMTDSAAAESRFAEWQVGLRAWTDDPLRFATGWGPEGYRTAFGRFVDDDYVIEYGRAVFTDRAHAGPIDIGLSLGVVGLAAWGVLIISTIAAARRRPEDPVVLALLGSVVGYFAQQLFLFPIAELDIVAFGMLGIVAGRVHAPDGVVGTREYVVPTSATVVAVVAAFGAAAAAFGGAADVAADHAIAGEPPDVSRAVDLRPDSIRYAFVAARVEARDSEASLQAALARIDEARDLAPADPALRLEEATIRVELLRFDPSGATATEQIIDAFVADDPRHPQLLMQHGIASAIAGDLDTATERLRAAADLAPGSLEPLINLALVLIETPDPSASIGAEIEALLDRAERLAPDDPRIAQLRTEISSP